MTSPSEYAGAVSSSVASLPVRLWDQQAGGGKVVSRLEFQSVEQAVVEVIAPVKSEVETD